MPQLGGRSGDQEGAPAAGDLPACWNRFSWRKQCRKSGPALLQLAVAQLLKLQVLRASGPWSSGCRPLPPRQMACALAHARLPSVIVQALHAHCECAHHPFAHCTHCTRCTACTQCTHCARSALHASDPPYTAMWWARLCIMPLHAASMHDLLCELETSASARSQVAPNYYATTTLQHELLTNY